MSERSSIAVIDVETTGLSPWRGDRVVEIGIVLISPDGRVHREYETLIDPKRDVGPTRIHGISAGDLLKAPCFEDVAGDILDLLLGSHVIAGHNISFDRNFLRSEFERAGAPLPEFPAMCTCRLFGRNSLAACCDELGLSFDGLAHRALSDAKMTAALVASVLAEQPELMQDFRLDGTKLPRLPARATPVVCREQAIAAQCVAPEFLQRISGRVHHDVEIETPEMLAYLSLLDRVLEDRVIERHEDEALIAAAESLGLESSQLHAAHRRYIRNLAILVVADGIVTETERRDLSMVARLLGYGEETVTESLSIAMAQYHSLTAANGAAAQNEDLSGKRVCFTGELLSTIQGEPVTRSAAEVMAARAGLLPVSGVTKKLDILVVADPNTQSGKAKKARDYGIRILSEAVFWRMIGVVTD